MKEGVCFEQKSGFACLLHPQSSPQHFIAKSPIWLCWDLASPCKCHSPDGLLLGTCLMPPTPHIMLRVQERCSSACRPGPPGWRGADETLGHLEALLPQPSRPRVPTMWFPLPLGHHDLMNLVALSGASLVLGLQNSGSPWLERGAFVLPAFPCPKRVPVGAFSYPDQSEECCSGSQCLLLQT